MAVHAILIKSMCQSTNIDSLQRSAVYTSDIDNGNVVKLGALSSTAGEAEARAYQNRVPTASTGANDGTAGEAQARANQNPAPQSPNTGPVEVNINGAMYQMFLNSDGYYYIPGENVPRDQKGNNVYRPGERMPMQGPKTAPFPRGYRGPTTQALPGRAVPDGGQISDTPMAESVGFANDELNRLVSLVHYR